MNNILQLVEEQICSLESAYKSISDEYLKLPQGTLKVNHDKNGNPRYYELVFNNGIRQEKYLSKKKQHNYIHCLAQYDYNSKLLPILNDEISTLKEFKKQYHPNKKISATNLCSPLKQNLIHNYFPSPEIAARHFELKSFEPYLGHPDSLIYETDRGEFVRSKSELLIANFLFHNKALWAYKYEAPLNLSGKIIHPDFTVLSRRTGKIYYIEHCGLFDSEDYVNDFIWKHNEYIKNGIYPGQQLIITYETNTSPLNMRVMKDLFYKLMK